MRYTDFYLKKEIGIVFFQKEGLSFYDIYLASIKELNQGKRKAIMSYALFYTKFSQSIK